MNRIENVRLYLFARFNEFFKIEFKKKNEQNIRTDRPFIYTIRETSIQKENYRDCHFKMRLPICCPARPDPTNTTAPHTQ